MKRKSSWVSRFQQAGDDVSPVPMVLMNGSRRSSTK